MKKRRQARQLVNALVILCVIASTVLGFYYSISNGSSRTTLAFNYQRYDVSPITSNVGNSSYRAKQYRDHRSLNLIFDKFLLSLHLWGLDKYIYSISGSKFSDTICAKGFQQLCQLSDIPPPFAPTL